MGAVRSWKRSETISYLQVNKLASQGTGAGRRYKAAGSETKNVVAQGVTSSTFTAVPVVPSPLGVTRSSQMSVQSAALLNRNPKFKELPFVLGETLSPPPKAVCHTDVSASTKVPNHADMRETPGERPPNTMTDIRTKLAYRTTKGNLGSHPLGSVQSRGCHGWTDPNAVFPCGRFSLDRCETSDLLRHDSKSLSSHHALSKATFLLEHGLPRATPHRPL